MEKTQNMRKIDEENVWCWEIFCNIGFEIVDNGSRTVIVNEKTKSAEMNLVTVGLFDILGWSNVYYLLPFIKSTHLKLVAKLQLFLVLAFALGSLRQVFLELVVDIFEELFLLCLRHEKDIRELWVAVAKLFFELERQRVDVIGNIEVILVDFGFFAVLVRQRGGWEWGWGMGAIGGEIGSVQFILLLHESLYFDHFDSAWVEFCM
jgi:hypothetical protein